MPLHATRAVARCHRVVVSQLISLHSASRVPARAVGAVASRNASTDAASSSPAAAAERLAYWSALWEAQQDVFTLDDVNENLQAYLDDMLPGWAEHGKRHRAAVLGMHPFTPVRGGIGSVGHGAAAGQPTVLVPLCGRSVDLAFLAQEAGCRVFGVDAVPEALSRFAADHTGGAVPIAESPRGVASFRCRHLPTVTLHAGDIFAVGLGDLGLDEGSAGVDAVWDRAAFTSVPPGDRARYARHLASLMRGGGRVLVELLSCNLPLEGAMAADEAAAHLRAAGLKSRVLKDEDVRHLYPGFAPPGLSELREVVLLAEKEATGSH